VKAPFIYALVDPREPEHVRYVGMSATNGDGRPRYEYHRRYASRGSRCKSHLACWVRKLHREGVDYSVVLLDQMCEGTPRGVVGAREKLHIQFAKANGHRLVNATPGGDGGPTGSGVKRSLAARANMSASQKLVSIAIGRSEAQRARSLSMWASRTPEQRAQVAARISAAASARKRGPLTPEHKAKLGAYRKEAHKRGVYDRSLRDSNGRFSS
jgi:hypothetical protein